MLKLGIHRPGRALPGRKDLGDKSYSPPDAPSGLSFPSASTSGRVKTSLRLGIAEGAASSSVLTIGEYFLVPLGIALKATAFQISLLGAFPNLLAALSQLFTPALVKRMGSRKRVIQLSALLGALAWVGVLMVPFLFASYQVWWLLGFSVAAVVFFNLPNPAWGSWVSDLVPVERRGAYLGLRASIATMVAAGVFLASGVLLDFFQNRLLLGFAIVFAVASTGRVISLLLFTWMYEPEMPRRIVASSLWRFVKGLPQNNLGQFLLYSSGLYFGVYLSSAFFAVYQLKELQFSYTTYVGLSVVSSLSTVIAVRFWGPFADRHGNVKVLRLGAFAVPAVPILWLFSDSLIYLFFVQVFGGIVWAGLALCSLNFVLESSTPENRTSNVAYFYAFNGVALFLGAVTGGLIVLHLPPIAGSNILTLFLISGLVRMSSAILFVPRVKEIRRISDKVPLRGR